MNGLIELKKEALIPPVPPVLVSSGWSFLDPPTTRDLQFPTGVTWIFWWKYPADYDFGPWLSRGGGIGGKNLGKASLAHPERIW